VCRLPLNASIHAYDRSAVLTYIDRQRTSRRLLDPDHEALMQTLREIEEDGLAEVHDAVMETLPKKRQFEISTKTDVRLIDSAL
jgi:DNA-binding PadR family transcriptional regulator